MKLVRVFFAVADFNKSRHRSLCVVFGLASNDD